MKEYKVRSRDLVDLVNEISNGKLILSPFFQRKLVWRLAHKVDFIKTILLGFPFPEIFLSRGSIDVETMKSTSCIVDGQQRMNTIREFLANKFAVDGKEYKDLEQTEKETFLKYEIAIIDLDLDQNDPKIIDIFKRLNRTFYALSTIEKMSSEFGSSEFMLVAKLVCGELRDEETPDDANIDPKRHKEDPNLSKDFTEWGNTQEVASIRGAILDTPVFTKYEVQRQVHLMYALNLLATLRSGIYARNELVQPLLDECAEALPDRDDLVARVNTAAKHLLRLKLPTSGPWYSKSNSFSLLVAMDEIGEDIKGLKVSEVRKRVTDFFAAPPEDYALAAKEAVNNKRERLLRHKYLVDALTK
jgi:hypothetical protein